MRSLTYWQDETRLPETDRRTRRQILRDGALSLAGASLALVQVGRAEDLCRDDLAINDTTALIFSEQAPLRPQMGLKDARAVWCHMPEKPARRVLLYFHGHNGYVISRPRFGLRYGNRGLCSCGRNCRTTRSRDSSFRP